MEQLLIVLQRARRQAGGAMVGLDAFACGLCQPFDQGIDRRIGALRHLRARGGVHRMRNSHQPQVRHAAAGRLDAGRLGERGAEHRYGRNPAPLDLDRVGNAHGGRGSAIAETLNDRLAGGNLAEVLVREAVLGGGLADHRSGHDPKAIDQHLRDAREKQIRIDLAVVDERDALARKRGKRERGRNGRMLGRDDGLENVIQVRLRHGVFCWFQRSPAAG